MSTETKRGFTIIEILTVLSIIIIIISLLVPALQAARKFAKKTTQKGQFYEISKALELFRHDNRDALPDSGPVDTDPTGPYGYCGAMKLCEALMGQDGMGFHPSSRFWADETKNGVGNLDIYLFDLCRPTDPGLYDDPTVPAEKILIDNLRERRKYIDPEKVKAVRLQDLYRWNVSTTGISFYDTKAFRDNPDLYPNPIITDVYSRSSIPYRCGSRSVGMPVLYYKADPSKLIHDANIPPLVGTPNLNIYNFDDNYAITALGCPWETASNINPHPMFTDPRIFLKNITNTRITSTPTPHNADEYILMSAGWDGLYGTDDDVFNFAD